MNNITAAIFDLDGTLVDSMWVWEKIDIEYLSQKGYTVPKNINEEITHLSFLETAKYFKNRFNLEDSLEEIMDTWNRMAFDYYSNTIKLKTGAFEFLNKLKENNIKIALATSNSVPLLEATLKNNGIFDLFDAITTTDEANKPKNYPDIYLLSANKLSVKPENCVVFEDIVQAINGAKAAGMKVVAVYDKASESQKDEITLLADKYINSYSELMYSFTH
ncbi:HAD family phosphatase [Clostridium carnis]